VLEYLGVPHDIDLRPAAKDSKDAKKEAPATEDDSGSQDQDIQALYQAANDLPSDDPQSATASQTTADASLQAVNQPANTNNLSPSPQPTEATSSSSAPPSTHASQPTTATIQLPDAKQMRVPSLVGLPVRQVIEQAGTAGLEVEISGNGTCREQAPAAGTMVSPGTKIVVRCAR
jgi:cell division protein FtsI (penicillin-binding protein 3)